MLMAISGSGAGAVIALGSGLIGGGIDAAAFGAFAGAFVGAAADMLAITPIRAALRRG